MQIYIFVQVISFLIMINNLFIKNNIFDLMNHYLLNAQEINHLIFSFIIIKTLSSYYSTYPYSSSYSNISLLIHY
jgi:hypothetical protein